MTFAVISEISEARRLDFQSTRFSLILPSQAAIAEAKLQLNRFLANLPVSGRDHLAIKYVLRLKLKRARFLAKFHQDLVPIPVIC
jgi:hypothetical protein